MSADDPPSPQTSSDHPGNRTTPCSPSAPPASVSDDTSSAARLDEPPVDLDVDLTLIFEPTATSSTGDTALQANGATNTAAEPSSTQQVESLPNEIEDDNLSHTPRSDTATVDASPALQPIASNEIGAPVKSPPKNGGKSPHDKVGDGEEIPIKRKKDSPATSTSAAKPGNEANVPAVRKRAAEEARHENSSPKTVWRQPDATNECENSRKFERASQRRTGADDAPSTNTRLRHRAAEAAQTTRTNETCVFDKNTPPRTIRRAPSNAPLLRAPLPLRSCIRTRPAMLPGERVLRSARKRVRFVE